MTGLRETDDIGARLDAAGSIADALATAWDAFDFIHAAASNCADPGTGTYAAFMFASAAAAEARDTVGFAPSMPSGPRGPVPGGTPATAGLLAEFAGTLPGRLSAAAGQAVLASDRDALAQAASAAGQIRELLAGNP